MPNKATYSSTDKASDWILPALPSRVISLDGQLVDTSVVRWRFRSSSDGGMVIVIPWDRLEETGIFTSRARSLAQLFLADRISRKKARTIENDFRLFLRLQKWLTSIQRSSFDWTDVTEGLARAFLTYGVHHTADKGNDFSRLRTFYRWGVARQHADFDPGLFRVLQSITAPGNSKGHHVRFRDALKGPFSPDELLLISRAVKQSDGVDQDRAIVMLHLELGHNPNASARLRNSDLARYESRTAVAYQIQVPRVKKRTPHRETKCRPISIALGQLLEGLQEGGANDPLLHWLSPTNPEGNINRAMRRFARDVKLVSPRTQRTLVMTARRFRFSIATHMAEEGASLFHIAEVLDHSDTQNVRVYVETVSSIADAVGKATDGALGPLVARFQGSIVDSSDDLTGQIIPAIAPHLGIGSLDIGGIGACGRDVGKHGLCRLFPPLSCYLCPSFAALRDGPHSKMLHSIDGFLKENQESTSTRIQMQLADVRIAILQVLDQLRSEA